MTEIATGSEDLLDLDAWDKLEPIETKRLELVDGIVVVSPRPALRHSGAIARLIVLLSQADASALPETEIIISDTGPATVRVPDLVVARPDRPHPDPKRFHPGEILLAVEIVSPGSRRTDYVAKRYDYEQAGIGFYWILDPDQRRFSCLKLVDGRYQELPCGAGERVFTAEPIKIDFGWDELT